MKDIAMKEMVQAHTDKHVLAYDPLCAIRKQADQKQNNSNDNKPYHYDTLPILLLWFAISLLMILVA
jgi:hypothetical protein